MKYVQLDFEAAEPNPDQTAVQRQKLYLVTDEVVRNNYHRVPCKEMYLRQRGISARRKRKATHLRQSMAK